jgi:hypothetical protein
MMELDAHAYLDAYGYLAAAAGNLRDAVKAFQGQFGTLEQDGNIGPKTLRAMSVPRCGLADHIEEAGVLRRWPARDWIKNPLTYRIATWVDGLPQATQRSIYQAAWGSWEAICGIATQEVNDDEDITISTGRGRQHQFDGPGQTLAWAELPSGQGNNRLTMRFDLDENWIGQRGQRGILLQNVAAHEFGHLLGISHSSISTALMAPFYSESVAGPQANDDVVQGQKRYGKPLERGEPTQPDNPDEIVTIRLKRAALEIVGYRLLKKA